MGDSAEELRQEPVSSRAVGGSLCYPSGAEAPFAQDPEEHAQVPDRRPARDVELYQPIPRLMVVFVQRHLALEDFVLELLGILACEDQAELGHDQVGL